METVKNRADINNPSVVTGYIVDGISYVPMDPRNRQYKEVQEWISEGNIPEDAYTQAEIDEYTQELTYAELIVEIDSLEIEFESHIYSGSREHQAFIIAMLQKIEGENPNATRNIFSIDGRTVVPFTKTDMLNLMSAIDIAQEAITN